MIIGGAIQASVGTHTLFLALAVFTLAFSAIGTRRIPAIHAGRASEPVMIAGTKSELARFLRHRPLRAPALIWFLWSFAPGFATPLFFYLTDIIGATSREYGLFMGFFCLSFLPAAVAYASLCRRFALSSLLRWSTILAIPQMLPLLFIRTPVQSLVIAPILGLLGGLATAAYVDLLFRSCPRGLEGAGSMVVDAGYFIAVKFGDVFGAWLYERGGFATAVLTTTAVYAVILVPVALVPTNLKQSSEGHAPR